MTAIELVQSAITKGLMSKAAPRKSVWPKRKALKPEEMEKLKEMRKQGKTWAECSKLFGRSASMLLNTLEDNR